MELFAPFERGQLHQKAQPHNPPAELANQIDRRSGCPAGREQVVDDEHPLAHGDRVPVHRQRVGTVLQIILDLEDVGDRKSTRLNSSHLVISYAVFCLKKKKKNIITHTYTSDIRSLQS